LVVNFSGPEIEWGGSYHG